MSEVGAGLRVFGLVQGVGYRYFFYRKATQLGLTGWVKNLPDGSVSGFVEGDRGLVESLIQELKLGPHSAHVSNIDVKWAKFTGKYSSFDVVG